jgi:hypothetical protein
MSGNIEAEKRIRYCQRVAVADCPIPSVAWFSSKSSYCVSLPPNPMIQRILHLCNSDNGGAVVEFAIAFPALLLMLAGIIQFSFAMWQAHSTLQAVSHFGRYAMLHPTACNEACIQGKVQTLMPTATVPLPTVSCTDSTNWMTVTASHNVGILALPGVSLGTWGFSYRVPVGSC